jgi:hypothetical protein
LLKQLHAASDVLRSLITAGFVVFPTSQSIDFGRNVAARFPEKVQIVREGANGSEVTEYTAR